MQNIIEVLDLVKRFGDLTAVNSISFTVNEGEIFGLLGPNGAGKTTIVKVLTTLLPPTSGQALVAGYDRQKSLTKIDKSSKLEAARTFVLIRSTTRWDRPLAPPNCCLT